MSSKFLGYKYIEISYSRQNSKYNEAWKHVFTYI